MKGPPYRVAVVGASSLLGKEVTAVLKERKFPVSRLTSLETDSGDADLPILDLNVAAQDLDAAAEAILQREEVKASELDIIFVAGNPGKTNGALPLLDDPALSAETLIIDLSGKLQRRRPGQPASAVPAENWIVSVPFLDREFPPIHASAESSRFISAHPASMLLAALLLRLSKQIAIERAIAQIFMPASEISSKAIEELQSQTVKLLSFQKIPEAIFGGQLAFNVLPRLRRERRGAPYEDDLTEVESRIQSELKAYMENRVDIPALRLVQVPVFYSLAVSLYVEAASALNAEFTTRELAGERLRVRKLSEPAPSQVQVTGSNEIVIDPARVDSSHENGLWIWAAADNMRLAAVNAVEIAERQSQSEARIESLP